MNEDKIGEKIKALRSQNQMTQDDLAKELNVTRQAVSNWERGTSMPDINTIERISQHFSISIDELVSDRIDKVEKHYSRRSSKVLFILSYIILLTNILGSILIYGEFKIRTILPISVFIITETIVYFTFKSAIKNEDYTMIAGYDRNIDYNMPSFKKMIINIENHIMMSSTVFTIIFAAISHVEIEEFLVGILLMVYIMEFILSIIFINIRYEGIVFKNKKDALISNLSNKITLVFTAFIFFLIASVILTSEIYKIENNTLESFRLLAFILPYTLLSLIGLFYEQGRVKKIIDEDERYKPSRKIYGIMLTCILLMATMVLVSS